MEVLAGQYVARAKAFGREFAEMFTAEAGKTVEKAVRVPTALISVVVLDDDKKPLDPYVEFVTVDGETYPKPPRELEVLAGRYFIRARALGKEASAEVELRPGEVREVEVVIPGAAGFDVGGIRITYTTAAASAAVLLATAAGVALYALRRRKH